MSTTVSLNVEPSGPRRPLTALECAVLRQLRAGCKPSPNEMARRTGYSYYGCWEALQRLTRWGLADAPPPGPQPNFAPVPLLSREEIAANAAAVRAGRGRVRDTRDESCHDALPPHPVAAPPDAQATCRKYLGEWRRIKAGKPAPRESNAVHSSLKGADRAGKPHRLHISRAYYRGPEL